VSDPHGELGVTVVVTRTPKPGREKDYEQYLADVGKVAHGYPGHMGVYIIKPREPGDREYTLVFRYDTVEHLRRWELSDDRAKWVARAEDMCEPDKTHIEKLTGMEAWFALPGRTVRPPPKYKMAVMSWVAVYPIVQIMTNYVYPRLDFMPTLARGVFMTACMSVLMTYLVMPHLSKLFSRWLYPH